MHEELMSSIIMALVRYHGNTFISNELLNLREPGEVVVVEHTEEGIELRLKNYSTIEFIS